MRLIILLSLLVIATTVKEQDLQCRWYVDTLYDNGTITKDPEFPGGKEVLDSIVYTNFIIPDIALEVGVFGRIYVEFIIDTNGSMTDIKILSNRVGWKCDEELLRVIKLIAATYKWQPGEHQNRMVSVRYRYSISIRAEDYDPVTGKNRKYNTN